MKKKEPVERTGDRQVRIFGGRKFGVLCTDRAGRQIVIPFGGSVTIGDDGQFEGGGPGPTSESVVAGTGAGYDFVVTEGDFVVSEE